MDVKKALKIRQKNKKKKPHFKRQEHYRGNLKNTWRRPRGKRSKLRMKEKPRGKQPSVGYRSPKLVRGFGPKGLMEVKISNVNDFKSIDKEKHFPIIDRRVGRRKKLEIIKAAEKNGIKLR